MDCDGLRLPLFIAGSGSGSPESAEDRSRGPASDFRDSRPARRRAAPERGPDPGRPQEIAIPDQDPAPEFHPTSEYFARKLRPRGEGSVRVVVSSLGVRLVGLSGEDESVLRDRYGIFIQDGPGPPGEPRIEAVTAEVPAFLVSREIREGVPELYRLEQFWEGDRLFAYSYDFAGWVDWVSGEGQLALTFSRGEALCRAVENFLRSVMAHRFLEVGAFLLHGAAVVRGGRAHVFYGPSGSGKTTVTLLSEGGLVLGDDLVLIREGEGGCEALPVPFRGHFRKAPESDRGFPLAGFYRLVQHRSDSLEPLSPARGAADLMGSLPFVMEGGRSPSALEVVSRVVTRVPIYRLRFRKSPDFWKLVSEEPWEK